MHYNTVVSRPLQILNIIVFGENVGEWVRVFIKLTDMFRVKLENYSE